MSDNEVTDLGKIPIFDGKSSRNYRQRCLELLKSYIEEKGWGDALEKTEGDFDSSQTNEKEAFMKKDRRTKGFLLRHTDRAPYQVIKNLKTAKEMWDRLTKRYMPSLARRGIASDIKEELNRNLKLRGTYHDPTGWMEKVHNLCTELENIDARFKKDDLDIMTTILAGLPEPYENGVYNWNKEVYGNKIKLEELKDEIFLYWEMNVAQKNKEAKKGYAYNSEGRQIPKCEHCKKLGHTKDRCWKLQTCKNCGKKGHIAKFCRSAKKENNNKESNNVETDNNEQTDNDNESFVGCVTTDNFICSATTAHCQKDLYLLDSGANVHITPYADDLHNATTTHHTVTVGGDQKLTATAKGDLYLKTQDGKKITLTNVLLVPEFGRNIININALTKNGTTFTITQHGGQLTNPSGSTIKTIKEHGLHLIEATRLRKSQHSVVYLTDMTGNANGIEPPTVTTEEILINTENYEQMETTTTNMHRKTPEDGQTMIHTIIEENKNVIDIPQPRNDISNNDSKQSRKTTDTNANLDTNNNTKKNTPSTSTLSSTTTNPTTTPKPKLIPMDINDAHHKFGHINEADLRKTMHYYGFKPTGIPTSCTGCLQAKARHLNTNKLSNLQATSPGERLMLDTSGPFHPTPSGTRYWFKIIDQYSSFCWDFFLTMKSEVIEKTESLLILLKNADYVTSFIRCDNAGEHNGMPDLCARYNITLEYTGSNTPQRNGKVERRFASDGERATAALISANLTTATRAKLWAEFAKTQSDLTNLLSTRRQPTPPHQLFYGHDSKLPPHLIELGRPGHLTKSNKIRTKKFVTDKAIPVLMCGYAPNHARDTYRLYNPTTRAVHQSRHVHWADFVPYTFQENPTTSLIPNGPSDFADTDQHYFSDDNHHDISSADDDSFDSDSELGRNNQHGNPQPNPNVPTQPTTPPHATQPYAQLPPRQRQPQSRTANQDLQTRYNTRMRQMRHRRSKRRRTSTRDEAYVYNVKISNDPQTPTTYEEAMNGEDKDKWTEAIKKEIENFLKRNAWIKTSRKEMLAAGRKAIGVKHVFKIKNEHDGSIRYKDRIVMKGYMAIPGVDYTESFSPVVTDATTRLMITIYLYKSDGTWSIEMIDFEAAFLNSNIDKDIYVEYPKGMVELGFMTEKERQESVAKLGRSMYGSVDASLLWYNTLTNFLRNELKMIQSKTDPCVFYKQYKGHTLVIMGITVDDSLLIGERSEIEWLKTQIERKFKITDLGELSKHLGVRYNFLTDETGDMQIDSRMSEYEEDMIKQHEDYRGTTMKAEATPALQGTFLQKNQGDPIDETAYRSIVGKIMHWTRKMAPETANATRELTQHMKSPNNTHWKAVDRFIGYVKAKNYDLILQDTDRISSDCILRCKLFEEHR